MLARAPLSSDQIDRSIAQSLGSVFSTMVRETLRLAETSATLDPAILGAGPQIMGCVGFVGEMNGIIHLRLSEDFAGIVTGLVLGMSADEVKAEGIATIKDTIGELTNMSVGGFKNAFSDLGYPCALSLPTIVHGEQLGAPAIKGATRRVYHFESPRGLVIADLQLKPE
jgi:chemotaxis protein CheX